MARHSDRLTLLQTFSRIVERGSISAAARDLGLSQAAASRQLARLEAELGEPLVLRDTHALSLTERGRTVLEAAGGVLGAWDALAQGEGGELKGRLRVVAPVALGQLLLTDTVLDFGEAHPGVRLDWRLRDGSVRVLEEGVDYLIRIGRPPDERLVVRELAGVERLVVGAPSLGTLDSPDALRVAPFLALGPFEGERLPLGDGSRTVEIRAEAKMLTDNIFALRRAAERGLGYAVLPRWMIGEALRRGALVDALPDWRAPELVVTGSHLPRLRGSRVLRAFRDYVEKATRGGL